MRTHYWMFVRDEDGRAVQGANISIYKAGTTVPAYVYYNEVGGGAVNSTPQIITNSEGYFEIWLGDSSETYGYDSTQKFKILCEKTGIVSMSIDYLDIFPMSTTLEVDETSVDTTKDKTVSNYQAKQWTDHISEDVVSGNVHNLKPVNNQSTDATYNKLVSNKNMYDINIALENLADGIGYPVSFTCEISGVGSVGRFASFGSGMTNNKGIVMPRGGEIIGLTILGNELNGTGAVTIAINGTPNNSYQTTISTASTSDATSISTYTANPLAFSSGDILGIYQSNIPTACNGFSIMLLVKYTS